MIYLSKYLPKAYFLKLIIILLIIISGNCVQIGTKKGSESPAHVYTEYSYYPNGQQEYAALYFNGKLDGLSLHWSEDGILISESEYSHGKPHGIWKEYYANQKTMYETHYFHGQKHGMEKWYYENGQIKSEQSFRYGVFESPIIRWHPNGSIIY